jgi:hypothetical protein
VTSLPIIHPGFSQLSRSKLQQVLTTSISSTYHLTVREKVSVLVEIAWMVLHTQFSESAVNLILPLDLNDSVAS